MWVSQDIVINEDLSVYAVVTMDEQSGNIYKESYIEDATGGINLRLQASGGLYQGDSVRVYLKGTKLTKYNQMLQLDSVDVDNNIIKQATQQDRQPTVVTNIAFITAGHQAQLIQLNNVEFASTELGLTYADGTNQQSDNRMLEDTLGNQIIVRTSGYANFANDTVPEGNGTFIGVVSQYNNDLQLLIRDPNELSMNGPRHGGGGGGGTPDVEKDFQDQSITSGGWTTQLVTGSFNWTTSDQGSAGNFYAKMSNYTNPGNQLSEAWLISPPLDFSSSTAPIFDFRNAYNFTGDPLEVLISTNYDGVSAPSTATWTNLTFHASTGGFAWVSASDPPEGPIDLTSYLTNNVYIAFKYTGSNSSGSTWEVDDIEITY